MAISVGAVVRYRGATYQVVGMISSDLVIFNPEVSNDTAKIVPRIAVEVDARSLFSIGDEVTSHHSFVGEVTGYEEETNRVVCRSHNTSDRVRFAYKPHELIKLC